MKVPVYPVFGLEKKSPAFLRKLVEVAQDIGVPPTDLAAVMAFETGGTFAPDIQPGMTYYRQQPNDNKAVGLIQFTNIAVNALAKKSGEALSKAKLAHMSDVQQLDKWVRFYFKGLNRANYRGAGDLYRTVFWPAARGKADSWVAIRQGESSYGVNQGLDYGKKGYITAGDIDRHVLGILAQAKQKAPLMVETTAGFPLIAVILGVGAGASLAYVLTLRPDLPRRMSQKLTGLIRR